MKRKPSKADLRKLLNQEIGQFTEHGGEINTVASGETGVQGGPLKAQEPVIFDGKKEERSYVNDVVAAIDSRKKKTKKPASSNRSKNKTPTKRLIYDDFGEPLRWVWDDE